MPSVMSTERRFFNHKRRKYRKAIAIPFMGFEVLGVNWLLSFKYLIRTLSWTTNLAHVIFLFHAKLGKFLEKLLKAIEIIDKNA